ncbi:hypothetical protein HI914_01817 [Erysiphe necator]|nr:hypothetical protein HI914_01817 [Erysiphe necator]
MRQVESQYLRNILQEWELPLEYTGGQKFPALGLPRYDYANEPMKITEVAAIIKDSDRFIQPGEVKTTQFSSRSGLLSNEYLTGPPKNRRVVESSTSTAPQLDYESDTTLQGMKLELQRLANP